MLLTTEVNPMSDVTHDKIYERYLNRLDKASQLYEHETIALNEKNGKCACGGSCCGDPECCSGNCANDVKAPYTVEKFTKQAIELNELNKKTRTLWSENADLKRALESHKQFHEDQRAQIEDLRRRLGEQPTTLPSAIASVQYALDFIRNKYGDDL